MTEEQYQAHCVTWFQNNMYKHRGKFRRVKNETDKFTSGRSRIAQGMHNKATGIIAGTWDAFFLVEPIVWIEFKVNGNKLSNDQLKFQEMGLEVGWRFRVANDELTEFIAIVYEFFR